MKAIIVNVWPTRSTPDVIQPVPFTQQLSPARALELLKAVRNIPQPVNTPLPLSAVLQLPRYYLVVDNGYVEIRGVRRSLMTITPTKWYAVFDIFDSAVVEHGYWHSKIIDDILAVLER